MGVCATRLQQYFRRSYEVLTVNKSLIVFVSVLVALGVGVWNGSREVPPAELQAEKQAMLDLPIPASKHCGAVECVLDCRGKRQGKTR